MDTSLQDYRADMWKHFTVEMPELAKIPVKLGIIGDKTFNSWGSYFLNPMLFSFLLIWKNMSLDVSEIDAAGVQTIYIDYHAEKLESHQNQSKP